MSLLAVSYSVFTSCFAMFVSPINLSICRTANWSVQYIYTLEQAKNQVIFLDFPSVLAQVLKRTRFTGEKIFGVIRETV